MPAWMVFVLPFRASGFMINLARSGGAQMSELEKT